MIITSMKITLQLCIAHFTKEYYAHIINDSVHVLVTKIYGLCFEYYWKFHSYVMLHVI